VLVGVLAILALGFWWMTSRHHATSDVLEGSAMRNAAGTAVVLDARDDRRQRNGHIIAVHGGQGPDDVWHDGGDLPARLGTAPTSTMHVQLGVVDIDSSSAERI
jgi:hypothetical protein